MATERQKYREFLEGVQRSEQYKTNAEFREVVDEQAEKISSGSLEEVLAATRTIREALARTLAPRTAEQAELLEGLETSYDDMVETLNSFELKPENLPTKEEVINKVKALSPELLQEIARFNKPTLLITPPLSRAEKIEAINGHKKYKDQIDTYCDPGPTDSLWGPQKEKGIVTIVDGLQSMPVHPQISEDLQTKDKAQKYQQIYSTKGLKMITADEYLMLQMESLHRYQKLIEQGKPHEEAIKQMVENWDCDESQTLTLFNIDHLSEEALSRLPTGLFRSAQVILTWSNLVFVDHDRRSRPSVQVFEF